MHVTINFSLIQHLTSNLDEDFVRQVHIKGQGGYGYSTNNGSGSTSSKNGVENMWCVLSTWSFQQNENTQPQK